MQATASLLLRILPAANDVLVLPGRDGDVIAVGTHLNQLEVAAM